MSALRTTIQECRDIYQDQEADLYPFIMIAHDIVDEVLIGSGLSVVILKRIEEFLACHFYAHGSSELVRETYAGATFEYVKSVNITDKGYMSTRWGQMALALDTSGLLKGANRRPVDVYVL